MQCAVSLSVSQSVAGEYHHCIHEAEAVEELQPECINNLASLMHLRWAINRAGPALLRALQRHVECGASRASEAGASACKRRGSKLRLCNTHCAGDTPSIGCHFACGSFEIDLPRSADRNGFMKVTQNPIALAAQASEEGKGTGRGGQNE